MLYAGVDLGTSSVKLLLMDEKGNIQKIVSRDYPLYFPEDGYSEQNPDDWWDSLMDGMEELFAGCNKSQVAGVSFGGQMHGLVTLDGEDKVIRNAILWNDSRAGVETEYLNNVIGKDKLSEYTANIAFTGFTAPKILWMQKHEPELWDRVRKIMLPKDYLAYKMTGNFSTDYSDASGTLLLDVRNKCWSKEMLEICHIDINQLPKLYESYEVTGTLRKAVAEKLGLTENVKVIAGAGDNAAAAIGTGTSGDGRCNISIGTSGTIFISGSSFMADSNNALHSFAHADGGYHLMGCMLSAASCNKWWVENILKSNSYDKISGLVEEKNLGENNVFYLPYLMGERSPHNNPSIRAMFLGMSMDTSQAEMTQAVLEGVAFGLRDSLEVARKLGIKINTSKICGGGARNSLWKKIIASVLDITLEVLESEQGPGAGAAILAATGCGEYPDIGIAIKEIVKVSKVIEPDKTLVEKYNYKYNGFVKIYPAVKQLFN